MSDFKGTPGPWHVCTDAIGDMFIVSMADGAETVCELFAADNEDGQRQLEADADLIAAAPELLSALKQCSLEIAQIRNRKLTLNEQIALDSARAAIAKALGQ